MLSWRSVKCSLGTPANPGADRDLGTLDRSPTNGRDNRLRLPAARLTSCLGVVEGPTVVLYIVNTMRARHPKLEVEGALQEAEAAGWTVKDTVAGHRWGVMRCPEQSRAGCQESIWSTPKNPGNHAKRLRAAVRNCPHHRKE